MNDVVKIRFVNSDGKAVLITLTKEEFDWANEQRHLPLVEFVDRMMKWGRMSLQSGYALAVYFGISTNYTASVF